MIGGSGADVRGASVATLQQAMTAGTLTSAELTAFYLAKIEALNPRLHAVITVSPAALADAAASDRSRGAGTVRGALEGIPVLIKDNIAAAGMPATAGSPALLGAGSSDAFLVGRLREAGAVILGKANLSEWANFRSSHSSSGWSTLGGQTINPHGSGRNPSGSSSGSAVAVAAGLAPLAIGTETDGSIISPASVCGVVGVKPTLGLVSRTGIVPISSAQDTAGPMTRCVADAAALLTAIAGPDAADPATAEAGAEAADYTAVLDAGALAGARLGIWREGLKRVAPATVAVLDAAIDRLRAAGAEVIDPVQLPGADQIEEPEDTALLHEFRIEINAYLEALPGEHPASLAELITFNIHNANHVMPVFGQEIFEEAEQSRGYSTARGEALRLARGALDTALRGDRLDAVVALAGGPAWLTDHVLGDNHDYGSSGPAAVSGYPAVCVLSGDVCGLPVGISFMGPKWSEPRLLALAYAFEQASAARR
jgi:amidase